MMVSTEMTAGTRTAVCPPPPSAALAMAGMSTVEPSSARLNAGALILLRMCVGAGALDACTRSPETETHADRRSRALKTSSMYV